MWSPAVQDRLTSLQKRHEEILQEMSRPGATSPALSKELSALTPAVTLHQERLALVHEQDQLQELLQEAVDDPELHQECRDELQRVAQRIAALERPLVDAVLFLRNNNGNNMNASDDDASSNAIVEIRAGTGGDEASLFAFELYEAYEKISSGIGFKVERLEESRSEIGGLNKGSLLVTSSGSAVYSLPTSLLHDDDEAKDDTKNGETNSDNINNDDSCLSLGPYGALKFESGVHRVQRVPINDTKIHTSACSVAVMPSLDESEQANALPMSELRIETMRSSGAGGQHVNCTDSACRITHIPTGLQASIQDERSQHRNREKALKLITARVRDAERAAAEQKNNATRSSLMGGGDRSERIRTYNYAQDRITDHRCKTTRHGILTQLSGKYAQDNLIASFLPPLMRMQRQELLDKLEEQGSKR